MKMSKTEKNLDAIFWYILYALPLILLLFSFWNGQPVRLVQVSQQYLGGFITPLYELLADLFSTTGIYQIFPSQDMIFAVSWFVNMYIVHLAVDVVLFVPRWIHEFMDKGDLK